MPKKELPRKVVHTEHLWYTPLWHTTVEHFRKHPTRVTFNEDMESWIKEEMKKESRVKSNRGGWQSDLIEPKPDGVFSPLIDEIYEMMKALPIQMNKGIWIPQLWVNVNKRHDYNLIHQHGQYVISGTYYVKVPKDSGRIIFRDPRPGAIGNYRLNTDIDKGEFRHYTPVDGTLMLWPSYLDHMVEPSNSNKERISISFDIRV